LPQRPFGHEQVWKENGFAATFLLDIEQGEDVFPEKLTPSYQGAVSQRHQAAVEPSLQHDLLRRAAGCAQTALLGLRKATIPYTTSENGKTCFLIFFP